MMASRPFQRVLMVLPGAFADAGGIEAYCRSLIMAAGDSLAGVGIEVRVILRNDSDKDTDPRYLTNGQPHVRGTRRSKLRFVTEVAREVAVFHPEMVLLGHVNFLRLVPWILHLGITPRVWVATYGLEIWQPLPNRPKLALRNADFVLAISSHTRSEVIDRQGVDGGRVGLLPCCLDPVWQSEAERFRGAAKGHDLTSPNILTVARMASGEQYKGIDQIIRALPKLRMDVPSVTYTIIGDGDDRRRLEELALELGVQDVVQFRGRVDTSELVGAYAAARVFAMPSRKEGFGIVFLEAAFFSCPSVGGRAGGTTDVIEDGVTGFLVDVDDACALQDRIGRLLADSILARRMGEAARERTLGLFSYESFRDRLSKHLRIETEPPAIGSRLRDRQHR